MDRPVTTALLVLLLAPACAAPALDSPDSTDLLDGIDADEDLDARLGDLAAAADPCRGERGPGISGICSGRQPPRGPTLRVMTYNVNFGLAGDPAAAEVIARAGADLVFLQETNRAWEDALGAALAGRYPHRRFAEPEGWPASGMGLLSRWPIVSVQVLRGGGGPFYAWRVVVNAPGGPLQAINLHLRPPISDRGSWVVGYFSTRAGREQEARAHLSALVRGMPALVVGDFNEGDDGRAVSAVLASGFTSVLPSFAPSAATWRWSVNSLPLRARLDHVLHDSSFRALGGGVIDGGRSDHLPVWVDLERTGSDSPGASTSP